MKTKRHLSLAFGLVIFFSPIILHAYQENDFELSNEGYYISEILSYNSPYSEKEVGYLGWFYNNTSLSFRQKHSLNVSFLFTHGLEPTVENAGFLQYFTNIESGLLYGFYEAYYQYQSENAWLKIGQQDIYTDFLYTENGLLFNHNSFGIDPVTTYNLPAPNAPYGALSLTGKFTLANIDFKLGIFDGQYAGERGSFLPISWHLRKSEGLIYLFEPEFTWLNERVTTRIGALYHSGSFENKTDGTDKKGILSLYSITDLNLHQAGEKSYHIFYQVNSASKKVSDIDLYLGLGFRAEQPFKSKYKHELGVAMAHARINSTQPIADNNFDFKSETAFEATFKADINEWLGFQPYFQYIVYKEEQVALKSPKVFGFRVNLSF
ncbi:carbohydrate porin [Roseivirga echinicomitans]